MCNQCTGLAIQKEEELSEFGERLAEYHKDNNNKPVFIGSLSNKERAKEARKELGIPTQCPHEPYNEETNQCLFHLSKEEKEELDIDPEEVNQAFIKVVQEKESFGTNVKNFINTDICRLDLQYLDLDSPDNRPIDFRFAHINDICLDQTVLHEKIKFDYGTIDKFSCQKSVLFSGLDAVSTKINEPDMVVNKSRFGGSVNFADAQFTCQRFLFENNICEADASFVDADILVEEPVDVDALANEKNVSFNGCEFQGNADFSKIGIRSATRQSETDHNAIAVKNIKITLRYCDYSGDSVSFDNARFGSWNVSSGGALGFEKTVKHQNELSTISFTKSDFSESNIDFSASHLGGNVELPDSDFTRAEIDMDNAIINGDLIVTDSKFSNKPVDFYKLDVRGNLDFRNCLFDENKKIRFENCEVKSDAVFKNVLFKSKEIDFHDFETGGRLTFENGQLQGNTIDISKLDIGGQLCLERARLIGQDIDFSNTEVSARTRFEGAYIESERLNFSNADFYAHADFRFVDFNSRSISFNKSKFHAPVVFANSDLTGRVTFKRTQFHTNKINFSKVDAEGAKVRFIRSSTKNEGGDTDESNAINFYRAKIPEGRFEQPKSPGTYYDFTEATVGDLELMFHENSSDQDKLFEYFRFYETEFDGFDFSKSIYRKEFKENGWRLESTKNSEETDRSVSERTAIGDLRYLFVKPGQNVKSLWEKYWRLLREGSDPDPDNKINKLESTYRKAKIGADKQGDSDASSKFFQKELKYRRRSHGQQAWLWNTEQLNQIPTPWERISRAWLWFTNWVLWLTSGYGEKPKRVILASVVVILMFATTYEITWALVEQTRPEQFRGLTGSLTLSAEMFTTIILGGSDVESGPIRMLSYIQGFIGSFFIALFVLTITRSVRR